MLGIHHHLLLELGELGRAELVGAEAARLANDTRQRVWTTGTLATTARELALRGEVERAFRLAERAVRLAGRNNDHLCCALLAAGVAHLADDDPTTAYEILDRTLDPDDPVGTGRHSPTGASHRPSARFSRARAATCSGRRHGRRRTADRPRRHRRAVLHAAAAQFDALGMRPWSKKASASVV